MPKQKKHLDKNKLLKNSEFQRALIDPASINVEARSVEILISTETPCRRRDPWSDVSYDEVLLHGAENVDLTRAATAKLRWMHGSGKYGELPLGTLENVSLEGKELRATATFSQANPDAEMFWQMVQEGSLTEISVGGDKQEARITERDGEVPLVEITRWLFKEASLVDIGADPKAGIGRNEKNDEGNIMDKLGKLQRELKALQEENGDKNEIQRKLDEVNTEIKCVADENVELKRVASINDLAAQHPGLMDTDGIKRFTGDKEKTVDDFTRALLIARADGQADVKFQRGSDDNAADSIKRAIGDSILMRSGVAVSDPHKDAHKYSGASMLDIARALTGYEGYDMEGLIERSMGTSDFPILLSNVANKMLDMAFEEAEATFDIWTESAEVKDFKQGVAAHMKTGGRLQKLAEKGELKNIEFGENGEVFKLESYGAKIRVTRQMLINDDMGAFKDFFKAFGEMARRSANGLVYDLLQSKGEFVDYKMADGIAIFDVGTHKNFDSSGAAISTATLTAARQKMRRQTEGDKKLNISPSYLLVPPEHETIALQLIGSESDPSANNSGVKNVHRDSVDVIIDSELEAAPWYIAAKRRTIKVLYLIGTNKKPIVRESDRNLTGVEFECVFDFGLYAEDFRGLYKNAGA